MTPRDIKPGISWWELSTLKLTPKIFIAVLIACAITSLVQATAVQLFFNVGFSGYLKDTENERLSSTARRIAAYYKSAGGWNRLEQDAGLSGRLVGDPLLSVDPNLPREPTRYALYNLDGKLMVGSPQDMGSAQSVPVEVDGVSVGMLVGTPLQRIRSAADRTFLDQQTTLAWLMLAVSLMVGAGAAWLLARFLLIPIRNLAAGTERIASGDYDARVLVSSSDELGNLAGNFNSMALTLASNERSRRQFMADISHELRTPLAILRGELESLEDGLIQPSSTTIASLQHEVSTLTRLVDDIGQLAMADVGALTYTFEPVLLVPLITEIVTAWLDRLTRAGLTVRLTTAPDTYAIQVPIDAIRLTQVFHNLLENAGRYARSGSRLDICVDLEGRFARIDVIDYGPGVPEESLPHLFNRFFREDRSRNRATGGSGLGLAISRSIVEAHSGTISATRSPISGLTISMRLPIIGGFE